MNCKHTRVIVSNCCTCSKRGWTWKLLLGCSTDQRNIFVGGRGLGCKNKGRAPRSLGCRPATCLLGTSEQLGCNWVSQLKGEPLGWASFTLLARDKHALWHTHTLIWRHLVRPTHLQRSPPPGSCFKRLMCMSWFFFFWSPPPSSI